MPKVEDVSIWLRWAVDPASTLQVLLLPPLLALPTHPTPLTIPPSLQEAGNLFTPFFLLSHPTPAPERLSAAVARPELVPTTQLYLKGPGDLALLAYSVVLVSFLQLVLSHTLFQMLARRWGDTEGGEGGAVWGAGVCGLHFPPCLPLRAQAPHAALLARQALMRFFL
ncbi:hypothetical protein B0H13DRAFT_2503312 [Mycena leptocephala]|nr:hypothetical protein B0H13DRAFT_2503312 [Mycena leptocephala]